MHSKQVRRETLHDFSEKKKNDKLVRYQQDRDNLSALTLQNNRERHTRHLKRDEVSDNTRKMHGQ